MKKFVIAALCLFASSWAVADAEVQYEYRHAIYESIGGHMTAIVTIIKNQVRMGDLAFHADALVGLAEVAPEVFPEGSITEKSEALPAIWEDPDGFDKAMDRFIEASDQFADIARGGDMAEIGPALKELGGACKGCHDNYRKE